MAASSWSRSISKRFVAQIWSARYYSPDQVQISVSAPGLAALLSASSLMIRRGAARASSSSSVYDKNLDEHVRPTVVPDEVIQPSQSEKYWVPHPQTGVFGPVTAGAYNPNVASGSGWNAGAGEGESVLEEKAFFRPTSIEDLEKPTQSQSQS